MISSTATLLNVERLGKSFRGLQALEEYSLTLHTGELLGVIGPNGAGKTTLFNCVIGDFNPIFGTIRLFGEDVTRFPAHERI
ncbi:MAG: ATP-binding cassette domain-containing protein, partial [Caldilinea sp.]